MRHSRNGKTSTSREIRSIESSVQGLTSVVIPPLHRIFFVKSYFLPDDVERPGLHFSINAPDILPHHTENEKLHAAHKKESDHEGCPPAHEPRPSDKPLEEYEHAAKDAGKRHEHADVGCDAKRHRREYDDARRCQIDHFLEGVFRFSRRTGVAIIFDADASESAPRAEPSQISGTLRHALHRLDYLSVEKREITGVERNIHFRDHAQEAVEQRGNGALRYAF